MFICWRSTMSISSTTWPVHSEMIMLAVLSKKLRTWKKLHATLPSFSSQYCWGSREHISRFTISYWAAWRKSDNTQWRIALLQLLLSDLQPRSLTCSSLVISTRLCRTSTTYFLYNTSLPIPPNASTWINSVVHSAFPLSLTLSFQFDARTAQLFRSTWGFPKLKKLNSTHWKISYTLSAEHHLSSQIDGHKFFGHSYCNKCASFSTQSTFMDMSMVPPHNGLLQILLTRLFANFSFVSMCLLRQGLQTIEIAPSCGQYSWFLPFGLL